MGDGVKILDWREAISQCPQGQASLDLLSNEPSAEKVQRMLRFGHPFSEYVGLYAEDQGQLLARVNVERRQWTHNKRVQTVSAISDVLSRPDTLRKGLMTALFKELHSREKEAGVLLSFLWTQRSWGAHSFYEDLGYRDVFSHPWATARIKGVPPRFPQGYGSRICRKKDLNLLGTLLRQGTHGRLGFVPRFRRSFEERIALGFWTVGDYRILTYQGSAVGYAYAAVDKDRLHVIEGVVSSREHLPALLDLIETVAAGKWIYVESTTFVNDATPLLRDRGYLVVPKSHSVLMVKTLKGGRDPRAIQDVCQSPLFSCHAGDKF